jgi:probable rRNA maturation factor
MLDRPRLRPASGRETAAVILDDPAWRRAIPTVARQVARAAAAGGGAGTVMLSSDRAVRVLNRTHRGIDKPTNVLTFEGSGDIVVAYGTVRREARAARRRLSDHLAHLVVHGALHLGGEDHLKVGEARRMELLEARILHRLRVPNPWKPR